MLNKTSKATMEDRQLILAVDFDGVINSYSSGFKGLQNIPDLPVPRCKEFIDKLHQENYYIMIFSARASNMLGKKAIQKYLKDHQIYFDEIFMGFAKPFADVYLDDKAVTFQGDWEQAYHQIKNFKNWNEKDKNWEELPNRIENNVDLLKDLLTTQEFNKSLRR